MVSIAHHEIGRRVRLSDNENTDVPPLEGVITEVKHDPRWVFNQVAIDGIWTYTADWGSYDVIEIDGKRLPTEVGVYKVIDPLYEDDDEDELVQLDNEGQWWPYPYLFSGWRTSELLGFDKLELVEGVATDYPKIKNPEDEAIYLQEMALKARIWDEGYQANKVGTQAFRNPYKVCVTCQGIAGEHDQEIHDQAH